MMKLYEIDEAIMACVDTETGEIIDSDKLEALQLDRENKIENICLWIKDLRAEAKAIAEEVKSLSDRKKVAENKAENLKKYLDNVLAGEKFKTARCSISYRSSESVDVYDLALLDKKYLKPVNPVPDKVLLKKDLKEGIAIPGATLEKKVNIQIK